MVPPVGAPPAGGLVLLRVEVISHCILDRTHANIKTDTCTHTPTTEHMHRHILAPGHMHMQRAAFAHTRSPTSALLSSRTHDCMYS